MLGCFIGVVALAMAKGGFLHIGPPKIMHNRGPTGGLPGHRFLYHGGGYGERHGPPEDGPGFGDPS